MRHIRRFAIPKLSSVPWPSLLVAGLGTVALCCGPAPAQTTGQSQAAAPRFFNDPHAQNPVAPTGSAAATPAPAPASSAAAAPKPVIVPGSKAPVQPIELTTPNSARLAARQGSYTAEVSGSAWADTHVEISPADTVTFSATGSVTLADGRTETPDGSARGWKDLLRQFPDNDAQTGALVGRIGSDPAVTPFMIGTAKTLTPPAAGELFLAINASSDLSPQGKFKVTIKISRDKQQAQEKTPQKTPDMARLVSPALFKDIPRRVQDQAGDPGDMVNFAIVGTQPEVEQAFAHAGWVKVDKTTEAALLHGFLMTMQHQAYTEMPMSTLYLFGRPQDLSYARADPITVAATRNHLRLWKTTETVDGRPLWVGSATHDHGFEKDQRNGGITHHIDPAIDNERDFIEQSFAAAGDLDGAAYVTPSNPLTDARTATGGGFQSDGRIVVLDLRPGTAKSS
jgi:hypothetical protein